MVNQMEVVFCKHLKVERNLLVCLEVHGNKFQGPQSLYEGFMQFTPVISKFGAENDRRN